MKTTWVGNAVLAVVTFLAAMTFLAGNALAQQYPTRAVKILVTIPPGGAPDLAARLLAQRLTAPWVHSVENRPA
jgi:tripartite-type tricarboxylate transporter receptor subunit TctC